MDDKEPSLLTPLVVAAILALMFGFVGNSDYAEALIQDAIRKDPPQILGYSIKQDSPGLDNGERMFPLHPPVKEIR